jgi:SAM-dependent methyltransferase
MRESSEPSSQPYSIFKAFEHKAWQTVVDQYDAAFSRLTQQAIPSIFEALDLRPGVRLLDAACGPGNLAAAALRLRVKVTGVDFSERMIARARMLHPDIEFREGDAENLRDFPDESFDVVAMNFGFHHLEQPENALKAIHRVLKPRGRFAFTVWGREETVAGLSLPRKAIALLGDMDVLPPGPSPFHFSEPDNCREAFIRCGFGDPQTRTVDQTWEFGSPEEYFDAILRSTARTSNLLQRQTPERLTAIRDHVCSAASAYRKAGKVLLPMPANLAWATKP